LLVLASGCATGLTGDPSDITDTEARVHGQVISDAGGQVEYWVEYGPTTAYGSESAHQTLTAQPNTLHAVELVIDGLQPGTDHHYRLCATDSQQQGGPGCGEDRTLTTPTVGCGDTVTEDVTLNTNLLCPQMPGLVIGADGVTINLAGHTLNGGISGTIGIDNQAGYDDVTVRNGSVIGWSTAIVAHDALRNRILNVDTSALNTAIEFDGGHGHLVRNSEALGRVSGIESKGSHALEVAHSSARGSLGRGMNLSGDGVRVVGNEVIFPGGTAVDQQGIRLVGSVARIARNRVGGWAWGGIVVAGSHNALVENEVFDSVLPPFTDPPDSIGDGIFVSAFSVRTLLRGNNLHDNEGDGIETQDPTSRLRDNTANDNGDFGIDAAPGVTDLGGNSASGNGNPLQCRNVACAP
jgi:parallel beta-helix repeat protein